MVRVVVLLDLRKDRISSVPYVRIVAWEENWHDFVGIDGNGVFCVNAMGFGIRVWQRYGLVRVRMG